MRVQKNFSLPSRTQQSFKSECDINQIMKRFKRVNNGDFLNSYSQAQGGRFDDFSDVSDYRTALDRVKRADEAFGALPSNLRKRFNHDSGAFLDFCLNPENVDEMCSLGLAVKPKVSTVETPVAHVSS